MQSKSNSKMNSSKEIENTKEIKEAKVSNTEKDNIFDFSIKIFAAANVLAIAFAAYFSLYLSLLFLALLITVYLVYTSEYGQKAIEKFLIYRSIRPYLNASKSLNHSTTLIAKYLVGLPVKQGESELETFIEIKDHLGDKWPFMNEVKDTKNELITVKGKPCKCISSYNYLDLGRDDRINEAAIEAARAYQTGNHGPRMLCGNLEILEELEKSISNFFSKEKALVFSSGYLACMSAIAGLAKKGDLLLMDRLCHASLVAGSKLSQATVARFKHNDFKDAEKMIKKHKYNKLIIVIEGVYSMDGDIGDLPAARKLCDKYGGTLILDEAHSLGAIGKTGRGTQELHNYEYLADIIVGTFTKSISSVGGFLTCSAKLREYYTFYAPGLVFSAPLSAYHCGAALKSFEIIVNEPERVKKLQENGDYLRKKLKENGFNIEHSITNVVPVIFRDILQLIDMHYYMLQKGIFAAAVMAPACPLDAVRFRICPTSSDNKESLDRIVNILIEARNKFPESEKVVKLAKLLK